MTGKSRAEDIEKSVRQWLEEVVIGLNLCPFARPAYAADQIRFAVTQTDSLDGAVESTLDEVGRLLDCRPDDIATTLVIFPDVLAEFDTFLSAVDLLDQLLSRAGADGLIQLAHFHPDYQFAGAEADEVQNYTNRAPFPVIHLLREAQVSKAVDSHPDPASIPTQNIERLQAMGRDEIDGIWP